jgi:uncharacterized protein YacL
MADTTTVVTAVTVTRPWYMRRRTYGILFGCVGLVIATIPGAPVIATVGAFAVTTQTVSVALGLIGTYVFGWGQGRADEEKREVTTK